jgi:hypothetical protein
MNCRVIATGTAVLKSKLNSITGRTVKVGSNCARIITASKEAANHRDWRTSRRKLLAFNRKGRHEFAVKHRAMQRCWATAAGTEQCTCEGMLHSFPAYELPGHELPPLVCSCLDPSSMPRLSQHAIVTSIVLRASIIWYFNLSACLLLLICPW